MAIYVSLEMVENEPLTTQKAPPKINIENEEEIDLEWVSKMEKDFDLKIKKQQDTLKALAMQKKENDDSLEQESFAHRVFQA